MTSRAGTNPLVDRLRASLGRPVRVRVSHPITPSDIRRWAMAVYAPDEPPRRYWDASWPGGIVAPEEFNPFAWPIDPANRLFQTGEVGPRGSNLNGGTEVEYGVAMRPGDVITGTAKTVDVYERQGRGGSLVMLVTEDIWLNQRGEKVKRHRMTNILV